jgi:hypothetical protein
MSDDQHRNPLPELLQLIANVDFGINNHPITHRRALIALVDFVREYDAIILDELDR